MNKILDLIKPAFENENYLWIVFVLSLTIFFKANTIFKSLDYMKKNKLNFLIDLEKKDFLDDNVKDSIKEEINNNIFKITTGITINKFYRNKILELYNKYNGQITLRQLKLSLRFIYIEQDILKIKISCLDNINFYFNIISSILLYFGGFTFIVVAITTNIIKSNDILIVLSIGFISLLLSLYTIKESLGFYFAKKIKNIIENK